MVTPGRSHAEKYGMFAARCLNPARKVMNGCGDALAVTYRSQALNLSRGFSLKCGGHESTAAPLIGGVSST